MFRHHWHPAWLVWISLGAGLSGCALQGGPDLIFRGGPVLTVNSENAVVEAVAVRDGVITAVGSDASVMAQRTARTEVVDLHGHALLPGFVAVHEHPGASAAFGGVVDVSGFTRHTSDEVWQALRDGVAQAAKGEWVYAAGIDPMLVPGLKMPLRRALDEIAPHNPVLVIAQSLHSFWANTRAFEAAGLDRNTPDPGHGSYYERDKDGDFTGLIVEPTAARPLLGGLTAPLRILRRYGAVLDDLLAAGITSVGAPGVNVPPLLARFAASRWLHPRIRQFFYVGEDEIDQLPARPDRDNPYFRIEGLKLWHDGSPYTGSMYIDAPYLDSPLAHELGINPGSRGEARLPRQTMLERLQQMAQQGWQVAVHSQGDRSNREVAEAFALVPPGEGSLPRRVEHCLLLPVDLLPELKRLGVTTSFHVNHIYYYGDALAESMLGAERADAVLPIRSAFEQGLRPTLHADSPMFPAQPFSLMRTAITRTTRSGRVLGASEAISVHQALRAVTINGAYQLGIEPHAGSIEVGKWADLQIVDKNPYEVPPAEVDQVRVTEVYVAGRRQPVHETREKH